MIKLKKLQLNEIYDFVNKLQLNKISNGSVRKTVLKLILEIPKAMESLKNDINETRDRILGEFDQKDIQEFQDGINEIDALIREGKVEEYKSKDKEVSEKFPEITKAYNLFVTSINDLYNETYEINTEPVSIEDFVESTIGQDVVISGEKLKQLAALFENDSEN